jgi:1,2-diacylglycerol 3-beta-galactosyltransferase
MLMGGGDGVGGLANIVDEVASKLGQSKNNSQMIIVCGNNKIMQDNLLNRKWPVNVNVLVKGFCNNIDELMSASDCLVTKAGPGTIAEAMIRGLPIVLSSFLPGQVFTY